MSNFGFLRLRVVNPYEVAFRSARSAVGADPVLLNAAEHTRVADAIADCSLVVGTTAVGARQIEQPLHALEDAARCIRRELPSGRVALLFGSEKVGLSREVLSHCHLLLRIPTRTEHRSMNLGQAVAVALYEIARDHPSAGDAPQMCRASAGEIERLHGVLLEVLDRSGYVHPNTQAVVEERVRSLLLRLHLSSPDAELLVGMVRQIEWKLSQS
jgi:TrmH family RNA methyltransferase